MAKKRKRSKSKGARSSGTPRSSELPPEAADPLVLEPWERPSASDQETEERARYESAWEAFVRGDFRRCRALASQLAGEVDSTEVRRRAEKLRARLQVDPWALGMAAVALSLLLTAVLWTFS